LFILLHEDMGPNAVVATGLEFDYHSTAMRPRYDHSTLQL